MPPCTHCSVSSCVFNTDYTQAIGAGRMEGRDGREVEEGRRRWMRWKEVEKVEGRGKRLKVEKGGKRWKEVGKGGKR